MLEAVPGLKLVYDTANMIPRGDDPLANYVWLPLRFEGNDVKIEWLDAWSPDDYE